MEEIRQEELIAAEEEEEEVNQCEGRGEELRRRVYGIS